jgi:hypothetical protein
MPNMLEAEPKFAEPQLNFAAPHAARAAEDYGFAPPVQAPHAEVLGFAPPANPLPAQDFGFGWGEADALINPEKAHHESNSPGVASIVNSPEHQARSDFSGSPSPATPVDCQFRDDLPEADAGFAAPIASAPPVGLGLHDGDLLIDPLFPVGDFINPNNAVMDDAAPEGYGKFNDNNNGFDFDAELAHLLGFDQDA